MEMVLESQEETKSGISRKIEANKPYKIWVTEFGDNKFYKIQIQQKKYDGTIFKTYQSVAFRKGVEIENGTTIKIINGIENIREDKGNKYNFVSTIFILDYEVVEDTTSDFISEYNNAKNGEEPIEDSNMIIQEEDLPF